MKNTDRNVDGKVAWLASGESDAQRDADAAVATWREVETALTPIIGRGGVAALYKRSLHVASAGHPWLAAAQDAGTAAGEFSALGAAMREQASTDAAAGSRALLQAFRNLLVTLIGEPLMEKLLLSVRDIDSNPEGTP